jgi:hypothetical protein
MIDDRQPCLGLGRQPGHPDGPPRAVELLERFGDVVVKGYRGMGPLLKALERMVRGAPSSEG